MTLNSLSALLERAKTLIAKQVDKTASASTLGSHRLLLVTQDVAKGLSQKEVSLIVTEDPVQFEPGEVLYYGYSKGDLEAIYGTLILKSGHPIHLPEFRRRYEEHRISEETRKQFFPDRRRLYAYEVLKCTPIDAPDIISAKVELMSLTPEELDKATTFLQKAGVAFSVASEELEKIHRLYNTSQALTSSSLKSDKLVSLAKVCQQLSELEIVPSSSHLSTLVEQALVHRMELEALDISKALLELDRLEVDESRKLAWLTPADIYEMRGEFEPVICKAESLGLKEEKAEKPEGKLVSLKMPDPSYNITRLKEKKTTGVLSRLSRDHRKGVQQFLVNELEPKSFDASYIWGVITLGEPQAYENLASVPASLREGIDTYSLEEFSTESPLYYMSMELVAAYDPPLKLAKPLASRRFGPVLSLPDDLAKEETRTELIKAGPSNRYANISSGSNNNLIPIELEKVLDAFEPEFMIRSPFVYLVGSTVNQGVTKNDIDVLIRGPLDSVTAHVVKFRLDRMLPRDMAKRVQFLGVEGEDIDRAGPFTAHVPLYDLVVRRREDFRAIIEMRDSLTLPDFAWALAEEPHRLGVQKSAIQMPQEEKAWPGVLQMHFRGASVHGDFRFLQENRFLIGFTLAVQVAGKVPAPKDLDDAKQIASTFSVTGSAWNKPVIAPHRVFASTKAPEPESWLDIEAEAFKPGTVGATRNTWGYIVSVARPSVTRGVSEPYFTELFLERASKFAGLLTFRLLVSDEATPDLAEVDAGRKSPKGTPFWTAMFTKSLMPSIIKKRSVDIKRIPPKNFSLLPPKLKAAVPKNWQYWKSSDSKERVEMRDELVAEGFFTEDNIKIVDLQFQRVVTKYYLYKSGDTEEEETSNFSIIDLDKRVGAQLWGSTAGKSRIANKLVAMFPEHKSYIEPFAGGAACFYAKSASDFEVVSDNDKELMTAFKWVKSAKDKDIQVMSKRNWTGSRAQFIKVAKAPAKTTADTFYKVAYLTYFAFMRNRHRLSAIDPSKTGVTAKIPGRIADARERLKNTKLFHADYKEIISKFDGPDAFFFLDPPYTKADAEVGEKDFNHEAFWDVVSKIKGKVLITYDRAPSKLSSKFHYTKITHQAGAGHAGGNKEYVTYAITNYGVAAHKSEKTSLMPFTMSWQKWKGPVVIRSAPSRNIYHLFIDRGDLVEDFQLLQDPSQEKRVTAIRAVAEEAGHEKLMKLEGDIEPGVSIGGLKLNDTKDTPSQIYPLYSGTMEFLEDGPEFKKFKFDSDKLPSSLKGIFILRVETGDIWVFEPSGEPGVELEPTRKEEKVETVILADGTKLDNVQVWDPKNIKPGDDKTGDRERLRPLALYKPMKVAPRDSLQYHSGDDEFARLLKEFATPEMLKVGIFVEKKANGFRASLQKDEAGRVWMVSEDIWERKQPITNYLAHLPKLYKVLEDLPGPYILDGEFMAVDETGVFIPRRELAEFRSPKAGDDARVRLEIFDILYHPESKNVVMLPLFERKKLLHGFLSGLKSPLLSIMPDKLVHTEVELKSAIEWARKLGGSEGAMFKLRDMTVTLRETDSMAKLKAIREISGMVWDKHPVKDSPGVYNFFYAVGPVSQKESTHYAEPVEVAGEIYIKAGKSFNSKIQASIGDVIRIEVTEILLDKSKPDAIILRGFTPTVIDKTSGSPSTMKEIISMLESGETKIKKSVNSNSGSTSDLARFVIVKADEEHFVLGVVLEPEVEDSQGDIYDTSTIRDACHYFMERGHQLSNMHEKILPSDKYTVLENYIAPIDYYENGQFIRKGTWMLGARILDEDLWQGIKSGEITGWSIEGSSLAQILG